ncbi:hypothetical protein [Bradyrhizobium elkanii]|nr:hypothetical protein [Bradyrhizobium elkanii]
MTGVDVEDLRFLVVMGCVLLVAFAATVGVIVTAARAERDRGGFRWARR